MQNLAVAFAVARSEALICLLGKHLDCMQYCNVLLRIDATPTANVTIADMLCDHKHCSERHPWDGTQWPHKLSQHCSPGLPLNHELCPLTPWLQPTSHPLVHHELRKSQHHSCNPHLFHFCIMIARLLHKKKPYSISHPLLHHVSKAAASKKVIPFFLFSR